LLTLWSCVFDWYRNWSICLSLTFFCVLWPLMRRAGQMAVEWDKGRHPHKQLFYIIDFDCRRQGTHENVLYRTSTCSHSMLSAISNRKFSMLKRWRTLKRSLSPLKF